MRTACASMKRHRPRRIKMPVEDAWPVRILLGGGDSPAALLTHFVREITYILGALGGTINYRSSAAISGTILENARPGGWETSGSVWQQSQGKDAASDSHEPVCSVTGNIRLSTKKTKKLKKDGHCHQ